MFEELKSLMIDKYQDSILKNRVLSFFISKYGKNGKLKISYKDLAIKNIDENTSSFEDDFKYEDFCYLFDGKDVNFSLKKEDSCKNQKMKENKKGVSSASKKRGRPALKKRGRPAKKRK
jgi:hypothetical protein